MTRSTGIEIDLIEEGQFQQQLLQVGLLVRKHLFAEVVKTIALRLPSNLAEIRSRVLRLPGAGYGSMGHLPDELQRGDPAMRAFTVLSELRGSELEIEDLAEQLLSLIVSKEQIGTINDGERRLGP